VTGLTTHAAVVVDKDVPIRLEAVMTGGRLQFHWSPSGGVLESIGPELNALHLSDDHGGALRFTGAFVGVAAQDLRDLSFTADFTDVLYRPAYRHLCGTGPKWG
jgi:xylan 1,4-beta-xylosidase